MDNLHLQQALESEAKREVFNIEESMTSLLYLLGIIITILFKIWLLKAEAEDNVRRSRIQEEEMPGEAEDNVGGSRIQEQESSLNSAT